MLEKKRWQGILFVLLCCLEFVTIETFFDTVVTEYTPELITYFRAQEEPTVILLFGDHQPHLPDDFYEKLSGKNPLQFSREDTLQKYKVPFMIWANYDIPDQYNYLFDKEHRLNKHYTVR